MKFRTIALVLICSVASIGCTTIATGSQPVSLQEKKHLLPIASMADALVQRFTDRGWAAKPDPARQISRFANLLSRGFGKTDAAPKQDPVDLYLATLPQSADKGAALLQEITLATNETRELNLHVDVYAAKLSGVGVMRTEMLSLEQAVLSTRKAKKLFVAAIRRSGVTDEMLSVELDGLDVQIRLLTDAANTMNQRRQETAIG